MLVNSNSNCNLEGRPLYWQLNLKVFGELFEIENVSIDCYTHKLFAKAMMKLGKGKGEVSVNKEGRSDAYCS